MPACNAIANLVLEIRNELLGEIAGVWIKGLAAILAHDVLWIAVYTGIVAVAEQALRTAVRTFAFQYNCFLCIAFPNRAFKLNDFFAHDTQLDDFALIVRN